MPLTRHRIPAPLPALLAFSALAACGAPEAETTRHAKSEELRFEEVSRLEVRLPAGDVDVRPGPRSSVSGTVRWVGEGEPELLVRASGGVLVVELRCPAALQTCAADLRIAVPERSTVEASTGVGSVSVEGILGDLVVRTADGDVFLDGIGGAVEADVAGGGLYAAGLRTGSLQVLARGGDVAASFEAPVEVVDVETMGGDVDLAVPVAAYDVSAYSMAGSVEIVGLEPDASAPASIAIFTRTGRVRVEGSADGLGPP